HFAQIIDGLVQAHQMIVDVPKIVLELRTKLRHPSTMKLTCSLQKRTCGVFYNHESLLESVERFDSGPCRLFRENDFFHFIDLRGQRIDHWEIPINDGVHECIQHIRGAVAQQL